MPANLVFRRKIWGARDNGIPPRSTPEYGVFQQKLIVVQNHVVFSTLRCPEPIHNVMIMVPNQTESAAKLCSTT